MPEPPTYPPPLDRLHALDLDEADRPATVDYAAVGIGPEHIPALIEVATDRRHDTAMLPLAWAPVHAWRALGALRATRAIEPLTALLDGADDHWILADLPRALGQIGAPAVPAVARYQAEAKHPLWSRIAAATTLSEIGRTHPEARDDCVTALTDQLQPFANQAIELNAFLIGGLVDLHAVASAPVIERAFAANQVDLGVNGDWEDVQVELGLLPARITPASRVPYWLRSPQTQQDTPRPHPKRNPRAAEKRRRRIVKQSKRRNRRRK